MRPIKEYFQHPSEVLIAVLMKCARLFPDELYLRILFRLKMGRKLNLKEPRTYSDA
jgi:hypothetical protein